jgi:hypothetical protein
LLVHGGESDVTEVAGDLSGVPVAVGGRVEESKDSFPASFGRAGVSVVPGRRGQWGFLDRGFEDGDIEIGNGAAGIGPPVLESLVVPGDRRFDLARADPCPPGREQAGQDPAPDDADRDGAVGNDAGGLDDLSRAVWKAMVNPQRSGSVPGSDSAASTMTVRSSW